MDEFFLLGNSLKSSLLKRTSLLLAVVVAGWTGLLMSLFLLASTREEMMLLTFIESLFLVECSLLASLGFLPYGT